MLTPEMLAWFGGALVVAGIILIFGLSVTEEPPPRFVPPEYPRHVPALPPEPEEPTIRRPYAGRHRGEP